MPNRNLSRHHHHPSPSPLPPPSLSSSSSLPIPPLPPPHARAWFDFYVEGHYVCRLWAETLQLQALNVTITTPIADPRFSLTRVPVSLPPLFTVEVERRFFTALYAAGQSLNQFSFFTAYLAEAPERERADRERLAFSRALTFLEGIVNGRPEKVRFFCIPYLCSRPLPFIRFLFCLFVRLACLQAGRQVLSNCVLFFVPNTPNMCIDCFAVPIHVVESVVLAYYGTPTAKSNSAMSNTLPPNAHGLDVVPSLRTTPAVSLGNQVDPAYVNGVQQRAKDSTSVPPNQLAVRLEYQNRDMPVGYASSREILDSESSRARQVYEPSIGRDDRLDMHTHQGYEPRASGEERFTSRLPESPYARQGYESRSGRDDRAEIRRSESPRDRHRYDSREREARAGMQRSESPRARHPYEPQNRHSRGEVRRPEPYYLQQRSRSGTNDRDELRRPSPLRQRSETSSPRRDRQSRDLNIIERHASSPHDRRDSRQRSSSNSNRTYDNDQKREPNETSEQPEHMSSRTMANSKPEIQPSQAPVQESDTKRTGDTPNQMVEQDSDTVSGANEKDAIALTLASSLNSIGVAAAVMAGRNIPNPRGALEHYCRQDKDLTWPTYNDFSAGVAHGKTWTSVCSVTYLGKEIRREAVNVGKKKARSLASQSVLLEYLKLATAEKERIDAEKAATAKAKEKVRKEGQAKRARETAEENGDVNAQNGDVNAPKRAKVEEEGKRPRKVCFFYQRGECTYRTCRFLHVDPAAEKAQENQGEGTDTTTPLSGNQSTSAALTTSSSAPDATSTEPSKLADTSLHLAVTGEVNENKYSAPEQSERSPSGENERGLSGGQKDLVLDNDALDSILKQLTKESDDLVAMDVDEESTHPDSNVTASELGGAQTSSSPITAASGETAEGSPKFVTKENRCFMFLDLGDSGLASGPGYQPADTTHKMEGVTRPNITRVELIDVGSLRATIKSFSTPLSEGKASTVERHAFVPPSARNLSMFLAHDIYQHMMEEVDSEHFLIWWLAQSDRLRAWKDNNVQVKIHSRSSAVKHMAQLITGQASIECTPTQDNAAQRRHYWQGDR